MCIRGHFGAFTRELLKLFQIISMILVWSLTLVTPSFAGDIMLVLDGSGSMWGRIGGKAKISIARETIADVLKDISPDQALGLMAYGHRLSGECADIEVIVPPAKGTAAQVEAAVREISPKGKTPISDALLVASDALGWSENAATVVLVSDGLETCDRDPCAIARQLEQTGVEFVAHVVGLGTTKVENDALSCIADITGGLFFAASHAAALTAALNQAIKAPPPPAAKAIEPASTRLRAVYSPDGTAVKHQISWTIAGGGQAVETSVSASPTLTLDAGEYTVAIQHGAVEYQGVFSVPDNLPDGSSQSVEFILNAGGIAPLAVRETGGQPIIGVVKWTVTALRDTANLVSNTSLTASDASPEFFLPAGSYRLAAEFSGLREAVLVDLAPGDMLRPELVLASGQVAATARMPGQSDYLRSGVRWIVLKEGEGGALETVASTFSPRSGFDLPPGAYVLRFSLPTFAVDTPITVVANQVLTPELELDAGLLNASVARGLPTWQVIHVSTGERIGSDAGARASFLLAPGEYQLRAIVDDDVFEKIVTIQVGEQVQVDF